MTHKTEQNLKPMTSEELIARHMFDPDAETVVRNELTAMARLKYQPNYLTVWNPTNTFHGIPGVAGSYGVYRATINTRNGKKVHGTTNHTIISQDSYQRAAKVEDCLNALAFHVFRNR